jgi:nucleotide-binding universal stress UspA family protein
MNARGSTEVIIASIGLSMGVLSQNLFSMIVTMAILTTLAMPPMLRSALARLPPRREEQERLAREEFEEKGFVGNLERLLLAVDHSPNADLAQKVAGWLAGPRELPTTVLAVGPDPRETVADEARKGFGLLLIGVDPVLAADGSFSLPLQQIAGGFEDPLALVNAGTSRPDRRQNNAVRILVPVSGSGVSRRGAEVAVAIARARQGSLHLIYVSTTRDRGTRHALADATQQRALQVLKETAAIAERYELHVTTRVHSDAAPEHAILQEIGAIDADLVVLGVDRLQGEMLDFGSVAAAVLARSSAPVLLVSTEAGPTARPKAA